MDHGILFIHECTFKLSAVIYIVSTFNTDALLAHGSLVGFIGSRYPIVCILMHVWLDRSLALAYIGSWYLIVRTLMHFWLMVVLPLSLLDLGIPSLKSTNIGFDSKFSSAFTMVRFFVFIGKFILLRFSSVSDCAYINANLAHGSLAPGFIGPRC